MLELKNNALVFSFPEVHPDARLTIEFQRTLRIPDDGRDYPLPPGLGRFPMVHIDDHAARLPQSWLSRGGVMMPMYQSEAMWLNFDAHRDFDRDSAYPFAIKIATGKINAASGEPWSNELRKKKRGGWFGKGEQPNDYLVAPTQPWLDGYAVGKGRIRQFVAMPLGSGYSAEEQLTGSAEFGGVQIIVYPMRAEAYERLFPKTQALRRMYHGELDLMSDMCAAEEADEGGAMGLAPGGSMKQDIYDDEFEFSDWAHDKSSRTFVHLANSLMWRQFTGTEPPHTPPTSREYEQAGFPWFDYYSDAPVAAGSAALNGMQSVAQLGQKKGEKPLPENQSVNPQNVVGLGPKSPDEVRDGDF